MIKPSLVFRWFAGIPFRLKKAQPFQTPQKILILRPCCLSQVMLTTPLLAVLHDTYPHAQIDWAICDWARPAIATNIRLNTLVKSGSVGLADYSRDDVHDLIERLRQEEYDTCFIPSRSMLLSYIAWRAGIPQRIGLNHEGRGFAHTIQIKTPKPPIHEAELYLLLAQAIGVTSKPQAEFYPPDTDRTEIIRQLSEEIGWTRDRILIILHPGGGHNPQQRNEANRWQVERFIRLGNYLVQTHQALLVIVGSDSEQQVAQSLQGLLTTDTVINLAGKLSLGELGALCEMADLYVGNDAGTTHVAAAMGCPTLAIFQTGNASISRPYVRHYKLITLSGVSPTDDVSVDDAIQAADQLLSTFRPSHE